MYRKIQKELLDAAYKRDNNIGKGSFNYKYQKFDKVIAIINKCYVCFINKVDFYLDIDKIFKCEEIHTLSPLIKNADNAEDLEEVYECSFEVGKKVINAYKFKNSKGEFIYCNIDYLKKFGKPEELVFYGNAPLDPVYIKNNYGYLLGIVLPIKRRDENV